MGDGHLQERGSSTNPSIVVRMGNREYLNSLYDELHPHTSFRFVEGAEKVVERQKESGVFAGDEANYSDVYELRFYAHSNFGKFRSWYPEEGGAKVFPKSIKLTPELVKAWYVCDGHLEKSTGAVQIGIKSQVHQADMLIEKFDELDFESYLSGNSLRFRSQEANRLLGWMGDDVPGYEYKWKRVIE